VQSVGAQGAIAIGAAVGSNDMNKAFQLLAHAALGCAIGTATTGTRDGGKGCVGGAVGGVTGELMADFLRNQLLAGNLEFLTSSTLNINGEQVIINGGKLAGAMGAFLVGGDVNVGAATGANAAEYNSLTMVRTLVTLGRALIALSNSPAGITLNGVLSAMGALDDVQTLLKEDAGNLDKLLATISLAMNIFGLKHTFDAVKGRIQAACAGGKCVPGSGLCFVAGTPVWTLHGPKPIEQVRAGDIVLSRAENGGPAVWKPVVRTFVRQSQYVLHVALEHPSGKLESIGTTPEHPFHVAGYGFIEAGKLQPGMMVTQVDEQMAPDRIIARNQTPWIRVSARDSDASGFLKVKSLTLEHRPTTVYNFEVADTHTYVVGASRAWVHNECRVAYGKLVEYGRPTGAVAKIDDELLRSGTRANVDPPGWTSGADGIDRGHLIAKVLGGSGDDARNIVTLFREANQQVMRGLELQIRDAVQAGQTVILRSTPIYSGANLVPIGVTIRATGSGGLNIYQTVRNIP